MNRKDLQLIKTSTVTVDLKVSVQLAAKCCTSLISVYIYEPKSLFLFSRTCNTMQNSTENREASGVSHVSEEHHKSSEYVSQADAAHTHRNRELPI